MDKNVICDTLYDIAGRHLLLLEVLCFPCGLLPAIWDFSISSKDRVGWDFETGKCEVWLFFLLSSFTWPWYISQCPADCLRKLETFHYIVYFCPAIHQVIPGMISNFSWCVVLFWFHMKISINISGFKFRQKIPNFDPFDPQQNSKHGLVA